VPQIGTDVLHQVFDLPAFTTSAAEARSRTLAWLFRHSVGQDAAQDMALIVSELVTNAIVHSGSSIITCALRLSDGLVRIEVSDQGGSPVEPAVCELDLDDSGRGLLLVSALAEAWGVIPAFPQGKTVWATVRALRSSWSGLTLRRPISPRPCAGRGDASPARGWRSAVSSSHDGDGS
jgi:serine/threonine-protein kinase RsbW